MASVPSKFGPYELVRRLGVGGMAETFVAVRRGPGGFEQYVCVKRILPAFEEDAEFVTLFLQEARIAARLRHANIVQVLDFGTVEGSHYLSLELVEGLDLRHLLQAIADSGDRLPADLVTYIATELASALDFAHAASATSDTGGIFHRDVSPSNVLLSYAGEIKLTDFGIAKAANQGNVTRSGVIKGKVPYMAPEYVLTGGFDARGDLFALGVVLYEALAGRRPFDGQNEFDTLQRSSAGEHTPLAELAGDAPGVLVAAVERLIQPSPQARFASAAELLDALGELPAKPAARRMLRDLVRRLGPGSARVSEPPPEPVVVDNSEPPSPQGPVEPTLELPSERPPTRSGIASAGPLDPTRTRAATPSPEGGEPKRAAAPRPVTLEPTSATRPMMRRPKSGELEPPASVNVAVPTSAAEPRSTTGELQQRLIKPLGFLDKRVLWIALGGLVLGFAAFAVSTISPNSPKEHANEPVSRNAAATVKTPLLRTVATPTAGVKPERHAIRTRELEPQPAALPATPTHAAGEPPRPASRAETKLPTPGPRSGRGAKPSLDRRRALDSPSKDEKVAHSARPVRAENTSNAEKQNQAKVSRLDDKARTSRDGAGDPRKSADLHIIVMPFGEVWVDGKRLGPAPVNATVLAGKHVVAAGEHKPVKQITVMARAGQKQRVVVQIP